MPNFNQWLTTNLEKFAIYVSGLAIAACSYMVWDNYRTNQKLAQLVEMQDQRIARLESEQATIKSQMVGWDTLKRIELYLVALEPQRAKSSLSDALRLERESRTK